MLGSVLSSVSGPLLQPSLPHATTHAHDAGLPVLPPMVPGCVDSGHGLHPFSGNHFDAGPVCLASIVHAFNYRVAVLRDGAKAALRTGRSRIAERGFMDNVSLPWGQQVAVMFQILSALVLDVPAAAECLTNIRGVSPNVLLAFEPWSHIDHVGGECPVVPLIARVLTFMRCQLIIPLVDFAHLSVWKLVSKLIKG